MRPPSTRPPRTLGWLEESDRLLTQPCPLDQRTLDESHVGRQAPTEMFEVRRVGLVLLENCLNVLFGLGTL